MPFNPHESLMRQELLNIYEDRLILGSSTMIEYRLDRRGLFDGKIHDVADLSHYALDPVHYALDPVAANLKRLRSFFRVIRAAVGSRSVTIGLSGGYDSRLLLLLAIDAGVEVRPFTYSSQNHRREMRFARAVAVAAGVKLRDIVVRQWTELNDEELERNINDALEFFGGSTNKTMGTFNDCHTARVHRQCVEGAAVNLNGLGGELYRNRERLPSYRCSFSNWLWQYVAGPNMRSAFTSDESRKAFEVNLAVKYGKILGVGKLKWVDRHLARRWYRDIWLPYFAGVRLEAENRVGPSVMPFADPEVSAEALAATPYIGAHGDFEAEMIRRLDGRIAALPSSHGPGFSKTPWHRKMREFAMAMVPIRVRLARNEINEKLRSCNENKIPPRFRERFKAPLEHLRTLDLPIDIDFLLTDEVSRDRTLYIAEHLYRQSRLEKICTQV